MVGAANMEMPGWRAIRSKTSAGSKPPLSGITLLAPLAMKGRA